MTAADEAGVRPARTPGGAAWRAAVVVGATVALIAGGVAGGSELVGYDSRLGMVAAVPAAFCVGILSVLWLRARDGFIAAPLLGTLLAVLAGAQLVHDHRGVYADGALHLIRSGMAVYEEASFAAGTAVALVAVVCAAVGGHRRPRKP